MPSREIMTGPHDMRRQMTATRNKRKLRVAGGEFCAAEFDLGRSRAFFRLGCRIQCRQGTGIMLPAVDCFLRNRRKRLGSDIARRTGLRPSGDQLNRIRAKLTSGDVLRAGIRSSLYIRATAASIAYAILCFFWARRVLTDWSADFFRNFFGCRKTRNSEISYSVRSMELPETREP